MKRPYGMTDKQFTAFINACFEAEVNPNRIVQTIGGAPASAGTHLKDGTDHGQDYSCATDLSVRRAKYLPWPGLSEAQIKRLLYQLERHGFAAFYRYRGSFALNRHIHMIYVKLPMKLALQKQVRDFVTGRDGLSGHHTEVFWRGPISWNSWLKGEFLKANPSAHSLF
jgi:hypothetical protein